MSKPDFESEWLYWYKDSQLTKFARDATGKKVDAYLTKHKMGLPDRYVLVGEKGRLVNSVKLETFKKKVARA